MIRIYLILLILVKAFSKEEQEIKLYNEHVSDVLRLKYKESMAYGLFFGMTGLSGNMIVLSVFYFGGISMSEQALTIGDLSSFLLYAFWVCEDYLFYYSKIEKISHSIFRLVYLYLVCFPFILN